MIGLTGERPIPTKPSSTIVAEFSVAHIASLIARAKSTPGDKLTFDIDVKVLAITLDAEGRNESILGRAAIAWTVKNRRAGLGPLADRDKTYAEICLRRLQYSCWWRVGGEQNYLRTLNLAEQVFGLDDEIRTLPSQLRESAWIAQGVIQGVIKDPVQGATHYLTTALYRTQPPTWATADKEVRAIEHHTFMKGIR